MNKEINATEVEKHANNLRKKSSYLEIAKEIQSNKKTFSIRLFQNTKD
jgi:hypothetical protein